MSRDVVVLSAVRSAIGAFGGSLADIEPSELAGIVMKEAVARSGVDPQEINYVTVGNCIPTDSRYAYVSRVASIQAGLPMESVAMQVSRLCSSGLQASSPPPRTSCSAMPTTVSAAASKSCRAYMLPALRSGARMGDTKAIDSMVAVLTDPFGVGHMGITAENLAAKHGFSREEQDAFASNRSVARLPRSPRALQVADRADRQADAQGRSRVRYRRARQARHDDGTLAKMKPAFKKDGTVTAGNASGINDGAAFFVLAAADVAAKAGQKAMARLVSYAVAGVPNDVMGEGPIPATKLALKKAGLTLDQMDVIESNEAFAAQALRSKVLGLDPAKTNPNGGAIALGHPVGCSGAFIATKALYELERVGGKYCLVTMCIGGGQGIAASSNAPDRSGVRLTRNPPERSGGFFVRRR
jgi:acetyl-CoA C-acetyltransferase